MGRRFGMTLMVVAATLLFAAEPAWACKFMDNLFSRCRVQRCGVAACAAGSDLLRAVCCTPVAAACRRLARRQLVGRLPATPWPLRPQASRA